MTCKLFKIHLLISLVSLCLVACGRDSGTDSGKETSESNVQYETFVDLPNCTSSREGEIAEILDDGKSYICKAKKWEEYVDTKIKSYPTEDEMPSCNSQNENSLALVETDSVVQVCKDSRWETLGNFYANEESLPNCSKNREGERAYLMEEAEIQLCRDGVWGVMGEQPTSSEESKDDNDKNNEPKSSEKEEASNSKEVESSDSEIPTSSSSGDENSSGSVSGHSSTSIAPGVTEGTFTDLRDGQIYRTVKIGNQEWFAQNLNYDTGDERSLCPMHKLSYCEKYGRLYNGLRLFERCPTGWTVPTSSDWETLFEYVDDHNGNEGVGKSLKASEGWYEVGWHEPYIYDEDDERFEEYVKTVRTAVATGDDLFHFSALPAGSCRSVACYSDDDARFWTYEGLGYRLGFESDLFEEDADISQYNPYYISIRCIKKSGSSSSSGSGSMLEGSLTDSRDNQVYKTIVIAPEGTDYSEVWMAENLNLVTENSWCGGGSGTTEGDCSLYGRLYAWAAAVGREEDECGLGHKCDLGSGDVQGACPKGWHLPSQSEWEALFTAVGGSSTAGVKLKSAFGWLRDGSGTDVYSFSVLPAGHRTESGDFSEGEGAAFWSSSEHEYNSSDACGTALNYGGDDAVLGCTGKNKGFSVRCLKD